MKLPGYRAEFDACAYGAQCQDVDGIWKPTKKATAVQTTKHAMFLELQRKCDGFHQHCLLEGSAPGISQAVDGPTWPLGLWSADIKC